MILYVRIYPKALVVSSLSIKSVTMSTKCDAKLRDSFTFLVVVVVEMGMLRIRKARELDLKFEWDYF